MWHLTKIYRKKVNLKSQFQQVKTSHFKSGQYATAEKKQVDDLANLGQIGQVLSLAHFHVFYSVKRKTKKL